MHLHSAESRSCREVTENPLKWTINDALKGMQHQFFCSFKAEDGPVYKEDFFFWKEIITKFFYQQWTHLLTFFYFICCRSSKKKEKNSRRSFTLGYITILLQCSREHTYMHTKKYIYFIIQKHFFTNCTICVVIRCNISLVHFFFNSIIINLNFWNFLNDFDTIWGCLFFFITSNS